MKITKRQLRRIIREATDPAAVVADYKEWAVDYMGTPGGANSSSVLATYALEHAMHERDWMPIALAMGFDADDVGTDMDRQERIMDFNLGRQERLRWE